MYSRIYPVSVYFYQVHIYKTNSILHEDLSECILELSSLKRTLSLVVLWDGHTELKERFQDSETG